MSIKDKIKNLQCIDTPPTKINISKIDDKVKAKFIKSNTSDNNSDDNSNNDAPNVITNTKTKHVKKPSEKIQASVGMFEERMKSLNVVSEDKKTKVSVNENHKNDFTETLSDWKLLNKLSTEAKEIDEKSQKKIKKISKNKK
jgi:hypothetical protein